MKKRKLKKKIKKLKSDIKWMKGCQHNLALRENDNANHIKNLSDAYTNRFNKFNPNDIKTINNRIDGLCMDVNYLRSSIERINGRCDILDRRTQTDYDKIIPKMKETKNEEKDLKSCSNCKYDGMPIDVAPCYGCTDIDKKMFEQKYEDTLRVKKDGTGDVYEIPCKKVSKGEDNGIDVK